MGLTHSLPQLQLPRSKPVERIVSGQDGRAQNVELCFVQARIPWSSCTQHVAFVNEQLVVWGFLEPIPWSYCALHVVVFYRKTMQLTPTKSLP